MMVVLSNDNIYNNDNYHDNCRNINYHFIDNNYHDNSHDKKVIRLRITITIFQVLSLNQKSILHNIYSYY